jgi:signal transduction histidine kinase
VFTALAQVHGLLLRLLIWLLKQPFIAMAGLVKASIVLLGEEARRWAGVLMAGLMILGVCWVILKMASDQTLAMLLVVLLGMGWLAAVFKALELTMVNRIWKVRQRQMFRKLSGIEDRLGERVTDTMARATQGTPIEGVFRSNRDRRDQEQADAQAAEEQAEAQRQEAEERERHLDEMTALEPNPYETQPR